MGVNLVKIKRKKGAQSSGMDVRRFLFQISNLLIINMYSAKQKSASREEAFASKIMYFWGKLKVVSFKRRF